MGEIEIVGNKIENFGTQIKKTARVAKENGQLGLVKNKWGKNWEGARVERGFKKNKSKKKPALAGSPKKGMHNMWNV